MVLKLILPLRPLIEWYSSFPFASLLVFFGHMGPGRGVSLLFGSGRPHILDRRSRLGP